MGRRSEPGRAQRVAAIAGTVAAAVAGALAAVVRARRTGRSPRQAPDGRARWRCACGQDYLVAGRDRHRVYWIAGADESDPVLSDRCPRCDRPLPAE
jgi:hypothetical protein